MFLHFVFEYFSTSIVFVRDLFDSFVKLDFIGRNGDLSFVSLINF